MCTHACNAVVAGNATCTRSGGEASGGAEALQEGEQEQMRVRVQSAVEAILAMPLLEQVSVHDSTLSEVFGSAATRLPGRCRVESAF